MKSIESDKKLWIWIIYGLLFLGILSSVFAFYSVRFPYWLPDFILRSLTKPFWVEHPRGDSFFVFLVPGMIVHLLFGLSETVFQAKINLLNFALSFYQIFGVIYCVRTLIRQDRVHLIPFPLLAYALLIPYATLTGFNGAPHGMFFFWILFCSEFDFDKIRGKFNFSTLFVLFYFCYPPFSFIGSVVLLVSAIVRRQLFVRWISILGIFFSSIHLIFLKKLFPGQTYDETYFALAVTTSEPHFYFLLFYLGSIFSLLFLSFSRRNRLAIVVSILFASIAIFVWSWDRVQFPNSILNLQYLNRIYVYLGSAILAMLMLFYEQIKIRNGIEKRQQNLILFLASFALVLGIYSDFRASKLFLNYTELIKSELNKSHEKCVASDLDIFEAAGVTQWQYPYYTIFQWEKFGGRLVYNPVSADLSGQRGLSGALREFCNGREVQGAADFGSKIWNEK